jgi:Tn3 transposase DDE domain
MSACDLDRSVTFCLQCNPRSVNKSKRLSCPLFRGKDNQLGALGLVVNMIVLWNTLYINAALEQRAREGYHATPEDVARLSPLVFEHINLLGRYAFSVPEAVTRGELRPLRNPAEAIEEVA